MKLLGAFVASAAVAIAFAPTAAQSAVGRTTGQAAVAPTGESTYTIPFVFPAGTRGLAPELGLKYSSDVGLSIAGVGWTLAGLSTIARCPSTIAQDGVARNVRLDLNDRFCLNGQKLRLVSGTYGVAASSYRTEIESFTRITAYGAAGNGPAYFVAEGRNGLIYEFGNTADSRIESRYLSTARTWALNRIRDRDQNEIVFTYYEDTTNGSFRLSSVSYTGNPTQGVSAPYSVQLTYEAKPVGEVDSRYIAGSLVKEPERLTTVNAMYGATIVRRYLLSYEPNLSNTYRSRLASVKECAGSALDCYAATTFTYQDGSIGLGSEVNTNVTLPATTVWTIDVNGDGRDDVVYPSSATSGGGTWRIMFATATGTYAAPINTGISNTNFSGSTPIDYNADGKTDLLVPLAGYWNVMLGTSSGFAAPVSTGAPVTSTGVGDNARAMDIDGDGLEDLVWADISGGWAGNDAIRYRRHIPGGAFDTNVTTLVGATYPGARIFGISFAPYGRPADVNGDGRADVVYRFGYREYVDTGNNATTTTSMAMVADPNAAGGGVSEAISFVYYYSINVVCPGVGEFETSTSAPSGAAYFGDFNSDGKTDLWYQNSSGAWVYRYSTGLGLGSNQGGASGSYSGDWVVKDWDGDGYDDLITPNTTTGTWDLFRSTGEGFDGPLATGTAFATGNNTFRATDMNGDGQLDLGYRTSTNVWRFRPHNTSTALPDLLRSAQDGYGVKAEFSYLPITSASVYTKGTGATFPTEDVQYGRWVVNQLVATDASGTAGTYATNYTYEAGRKNVQGRGFLGFAKRTAVDTRLGYNEKSIETYRQDFPYIGALASVERQQANGTRIELVTNTWAALDYGTGYDARSYPYVRIQSTDQHEVAAPYNGTKFRTVTTAIAAAGGIDSNSGTVLDQTTTITEVATGLSSGSSLTERRQYTGVLNDTTNWCLGRPMATALTRSHTLNAGAAIARTTDAVGLPAVS